MYRQPKAALLRLVSVLSIACIITAINRCTWLHTGSRCPSIESICRGVYIRLDMHTNWLHRMARHQKALIPLVR